MEEKQYDKTFETALVIAGDTRHARIDRSFLWHVGVHDVALSQSGDHALRSLAAKPTDLIICDISLQDMSGVEFVRRALGELNMQTPPVITAGSDAREEIVLDAVAAGCAGHLIRPYSNDVFRRQLDNASTVAGVNSDAREALLQARKHAEDGSELQVVGLIEDSVYDKAKAKEFFYEGCVHLTARRYDNAIVCFSKAVAVEGMFAEAYVGMAKAWKGKGDTHRYKACMLKAAEAYASMDNFLKIRELFVDILKTIPKTKNPFLELGFRLVRRGEYEAAANAYVQAESMNPDPQDKYISMAAACRLTADPVASAAFLADALSSMQGMSDVESVFRSILNAMTREPEKALRRKRTFSPPSLNDIWGFGAPSGAANIAGRLLLDAPTRNS